jgi:hypothetical protein
MEDKISLALMDGRYFTRFFLSSPDFCFNLSRNNILTFHHFSYDHFLCFLPVMITKPMKMMLHISSLPLQYSHSIMRLSFNSWEVSLIYVMKRNYVLNEIVRRGKRSIYQISLGVLRSIKSIHHLIPENPIERRKMSRICDDCE